MLFPFYPYYEKIEQIRIGFTINHLRLCLPPFLDVGCGSKEISDSVNAVTTDVNKEHKPSVVADITHLPFRDGCFETVSAFEVVEHVTSDELAIKELWRVSKSKVVLSVPNSLRYNAPFFPFRRRGFMSPDHKKEYTLDEMVQLVSGVDLQVTRLEGIGYCLPFHLSNFYVGLGIFPRIFPQFATYIYVECMKGKSRSK